MPKTTKSSAQGSRPVSPSEEDMSNTQEELSSSKHNADPEVSFQPNQPLQPSTSQVRQPQTTAGMYMPYIEGPHIDWTVNDGLYHRFLKWCLKCKNILECKLAALPECQQCKKAIACSRDCRMDQYVSWNLSSDELTLETIWGKYDNYCKPQSNEVWARFDLLMSFRQGNHSIDKWYNAIQVQVNLAKYPLETAKYSIGTSFVSSSKMKILCPGPSVMEALTWTNSLQVEYNNWPKNLKVQKPLQDI